MTAAKLSAICTGFYMSLAISFPAFFTVICCIGSGYMQEGPLAYASVFGIVSCVFVGLFGGFAFEQKAERAAKAERIAFRKSCGLL